MEPLRLYLQKFRESEEKGGKKGGGGGSGS